MTRYEWEALLVTRGPEGMSLFRPGREPVHIPAQARQVFDDSGAGDTVAAVVGLSLASGWGLEKAAILGNLAGGVVVGKLATAPLTAGELLKAASDNF
jgi:D-beta-D-heptose 7-phosphate kinase/D-beta-D-heptose 1-phosphate adenosyltransferase